MTHRHRTGTRAHVQTRSTGRTRVRFHHSQGLHRTDHSAGIRSTQVNTTHAPGQRDYSLGRSNIGIEVAGLPGR